MQQIKTLKHIPARVLLLCAGLIIMAFGVAFSVKAGLGTSPISSVPYVTSVISGLSVGTTTIIMNCIFVLIQIAILRKNYQWFQLLQIPAAVLFGVMIDVGEWAIRGIPCSGYLAQWILCVIGILLIAVRGQRGGNGRADHHSGRGHRAGHPPGAAGEVRQHEGRL